MSLSAAKETILDLLDAVDNGDVPSVERLIAQDNNNDIDVNARDVYGRTALTQACLVNNARMVHFLLEQGGADANVPDQKGWTPLHHACFQNYPFTRYARESGLEKQKEAVVSMLLKHGLLQ